MLKKAALAVFGLVLALSFMAPAKAAAEVHVGIAVGAPVVYGAVEVAPAPYVTYEQPYATYAQPYVTYAQPYATYDAPVYYGTYYSEGHRDHGHHYGWRDRDDYYGHGRHGRWHGEERGEHHRHWHDD